MDLRLKKKTWKFFVSMLICSDFPDIPLPFSILTMNRISGSPLAGHNYFYTRMNGIAISRIYAEFLGFLATFSRKKKSFERLIPLFIAFINS